jgi:hypothetical protein
MVKVKQSIERERERGERERAPPIQCASYKITTSI